MACLLLVCAMARAQQGNFWPATDPRLTDEDPFRPVSPQPDDGDPPAPEPESGPNPTSPAAPAAGSPPAVPAAAQAGQRVPTGQISLNIGGLDLDGFSNLPMPALQPRILLATYAGGRGDQYITRVEIDGRGGVVAHGKGFTVEYNVATNQARMRGDIHAHDEGGMRAAELPNLKGTSKQLVHRPSGQTITATTLQVHAILQQPLVRSSAGWQLWGFSHARAQAHALMADSRAYDLWPMPGGLVGVMCWTDGGNSVLVWDPKDPSRRLEALRRGFLGGIGGVGTYYYQIDPKREGEIVHATGVYGPRAQRAVDAWGRVYLPFAQDRGAAPQDALGMGGLAGVSVLSPDFSRLELNTRLGGMTADERPPASPRGERRPDRQPNGMAWAHERLGAIALRGNVLVLGGTTAARGLKTTDNAPHKVPGGNQDGLLIVLQLW